MVVAGEVRQRRLLYTCAMTLYSSNISNIYAQCSMARAEKRHFNPVANDLYEHGKALKSKKRFRDARAILVSCRHISQGDESMIHRLDQYIAECDLQIEMQDQGLCRHELYEIVDARAVVRLAIDNLGDTMERKIALKLSKNGLDRPERLAKYEADNLFRLLAKDLQLAPGHARAIADEYGRIPQYSAQRLEMCTAVVGIIKKLMSVLKGKDNEDED